MPRGGETVFVLNNEGAQGPALNGQSIREEEEWRGGMGGGGGGDGNPMLQ